MKQLRGLGLALFFSGTALAAYTALPVTVQSDGRSPVAWYPLDSIEKAQFQLGHAVFNTSWIPAGEGSGRRDGLGPLFNSVSCDACHNSRRRGRGPVGDGSAPTDFVMQVGRLKDGRIEQGHPLFGQIINTDAIAGFSPEAEVHIRYLPHERIRADGSMQRLQKPDYRVVVPEHQFLPSDLVLKPRVAPQVMGVGLLEKVPIAAILEGTRQGRGKPRGTASWIDTNGGLRLGRFGWQATEADIAGQTATAFAREMGLTTRMIEAIDCAVHDHTCVNAPEGGSPEVADDLFDAVVAFQQLEALRRTPEAAANLMGSPDAGKLFARIGCADCHRPRLPLASGGTIAPYTDLLLHDLGPELADRDVAGNPVPSLWRTAPLWGLSTAHEGGRTVRLMHDGRARDIDEAIGWHGGSAAEARHRYDRLDAKQRARLITWISSL